MAVLISSDATSAEVSSPSSNVSAGTIIQVQINEVERAPEARYQVWLDTSPATGKENWTPMMFVSGPGLNIIGLERRTKVRARLVPIGGTVSVSVETV